MFERIERAEVLRLTEKGAQLVEVLPRGEYEYEHIAGATHIWLRQLDAEASKQLDKTRPVIVYCNDYLCDMSPRAARRLSHLGFEQVYDYVPGKTDWMAAGLPREGEATRTRNAAELAERDVPTCHFRAPAGQVRALMRDAGGNFCVAVDEDTVVLGMVYRGELEAAGDERVEQVMHPGPTTVRASEPVEPLIERMKQADVHAILVTDPEGRLLGLLDRHQAEAASAPSA